MQNAKRRRRLIAKRPNHGRRCRLGCGDWRLASQLREAADGPTQFPQTRIKIMSDTDHCINVCNKLLRGELSAVETYDKAIDKYGDEPALAELRRIRGEHADSVMRLQQNVRDMGGTPSTESGAWGTFAGTVQSAADFFGAGSAVEALKRGEEHGRKEYQEALDDEQVMPGCKAMMRDELLPRTNRHIATLERLEDAV